MIMAQTVCPYVPDEPRSKQWNQGVYFKRQQCHSLSSDSHDYDRHVDGLRECVLEKRRVFRGEDSATTDD